MDKIKSISRKFKTLFKITIIIVPLLNAVVWFFYNELPDEITVTLLPHSLNLNHININATTKPLAFLVCTLQVTVIWYALVQLINLFSNYERGIIFSSRNVTYYRKLGYAVFVGVLTNKVVDALISVILTFQNPVGMRQIVFRCGSSDLLGIVIGGLIILTAWIMQEGHQLNEEHSLII